MRCFQPRCSRRALALLMLVGWSCRAAAEPPVQHDPALDRALAQMRAQYLATQPFDRLDVTLLLREPDGRWRSGSFNPHALAYPASCVKLPFMVAAIARLREQGVPYSQLDEAIRPMIEVSSNELTGVVVDAFSGAANRDDIIQPDLSLLEWHEKRLYAEQYLAARGLLGEQTVLHKTYPTNSGDVPTGAERAVRQWRPGNLMEPYLSAMLMLQIVRGALEPQAQDYMRELLRRGRWVDTSSIGFGLPPGALYENKVGIAYDTLEDIAFVRLPNGRELILAAYSNGWDRTQQNPFDAAPLGTFAERLVAALELCDGCPPRVVVDDLDPGFAAQGAWRMAMNARDAHGATCRYVDAAQTDASAVWDLNVPSAGLYEVSVRAPQTTLGALAARFTVRHEDRGCGAQTAVLLDQRYRGGAWTPLGSFWLAAGADALRSAAGRRMAAGFWLPTRCVRCAGQTERCRST